MTTFTLRLNDEEAEALNRLSYVYGVSKNRLLDALIASEYEAMIYCGTTIDGDEEVDPEFFARTEDFPYDLDNIISSMEDEPATKDIKNLIKCYDYAIENGDFNGEEGAKNLHLLEENRREWAELYRSSKVK